MDSLSTEINGIIQDELLNFDSIFSKQTFQYKLVVYKKDYSSRGGGFWNERIKVLLIDTLSDSLLGIGYVLKGLNFPIYGIYDENAFNYLDSLNPTWQ